MSFQRTASASVRLSYLALTVGMTLTTSVWMGERQAIAQEDPCYMRTSSGQVINLGKLCGNAGAAASRTVFTVPIKRRQGNTPVIDVTFNGQQTFEMIVDTGASNTLITRGMADTLQVPIVGAKPFTIADGSLVMFPLGQLQSIAVNGAEIRNVKVAIAPRAGIGLLGHDFFGNYDVNIRKNVVEFRRR